VTSRRAALAALLLAFMLPAGAAARSHIDDKIQQQQQHLHDVHMRLNEKHRQLEGARALVGTIQSQLDSTTHDISVANGTLAQLQGSLHSTERKIAWNKVQLAAAQTTLRRHQDALNRRLVDAYEHGDLGYVDVLLAARSFGDFIERWNDIRYLVKANQSTIRARRADEAHVTGIERGLEGTQAELAGETAQVDQQRRALDGLALQRKTLLAAADAQRANVQTQVAQLDEESAQGEADLENSIREKQAEEERRREEARRAAMLSGEALPPEPQAVGHLSWPVSGPITSPFGMRNNPVTHVFILHAGIDIAVPTGTTVAAAATGRVIIAGWDTSGCGNMVIIDHGNKLATQYCHLSQIFVAVGQDVQRGQAIAASGSTGNSTGPHVHFGVHVNGKAVDPMGYLR